MGASPGECFPDGTGPRGSPVSTGAGSMVSDFLQDGGPLRPHLCRVGPGRHQPLRSTDPSPAPWPWSHPGQRRVSYRGSNINTSGPTGTPFGRTASSWPRCVVDAQGKAPTHQLRGREVQPQPRGPLGTRLCGVPAGRGRARRLPQTLSGTLRQNDVSRAGEDQGSLPPASAAKPQPSRQRPRGRGQQCPWGGIAPRGPSRPPSRPGAGSHKRNRPLTAVRGVSEEKVGANPPCRALPWGRVQAAAGCAARRLGLRPGGRQEAPLAGRQGSGGGGCQ